jgi:hypothetical protein
MQGYTGLKDNHLAGFFSSKHRRKVLKKQKLISKAGAILEG